MELVQQPAQQQRDGFISMQQAQTLVTDKESLYYAMLRNKFFMPKANEAIVTIKFLLGVREEKYFLPKTRQVRRDQCPDPPSKKLIAEACSRVLADYSVARKNNLSAT